MALLRSEVFYTNPPEVSGHELENVVVEEGEAAVVGGASDSGEVASVGINFSLRHPRVVVDLRSGDDVCY